MVTVWIHKSKPIVYNVYVVRAAGTIAGSIQMPEIEVFLLRETRKFMQHDDEMLRMHIQCRLWFSWKNLWIRVPYNC